MPIHPALDCSDDTLTFNVDYSWKQVEEWWNELYSDPELYGNSKVSVDYRQHLDEPSGLQIVKLKSAHFNCPLKIRYRILDLTGTSVKQAIDRILTFYTHKTYRKNIGDHTFFEGFYLDKDGIPTIMLGS